MANLVQPGELAALLRTTVDPDAETIAIRMAQGWLQDATSLEVWPDPVPPRLWSWAIELTAQAYENPTGLDTDTTGDNTLVYARARRGEILAAASRAYAGAATQPQGCFPPAENF